MIAIIIILFIIFNKSNCPNIIKYIFGLIGIALYIKKRNNVKLNEQFTLSQLRSRSIRKLKDKRAIFIRSKQLSLEELNKIAIKISETLDMSNLLDIENRITYETNNFVRNDKCYTNSETADCKKRQLNNVYIIIKTEYADTKLRDDIYANTREYSKMYAGILPNNSKSVNRKYLYHYFKKFIRLLKLNNKVIVSYG